MAQKLDFNLPFNDLRQYVPQHLRNSVISGLLDNLFNRFMTRDESVPMFGYVGRKPSSPEDKSPRISQLNADRDVNAITPVLNFNVGSEEFAFTAMDIIKKAENIGIPTSDLNWLYSQGNNFLPPVDFDKFTNFYDYYWVAKALENQPALGWNPELLPEYYVISRPNPADLVKLNVKTSSSSTEQVVLTGTGFLDQLFTLTFIDSDTFDIQASASLTGPLGAWTVSTDLADYSGTTAPDIGSSDIVNRKLRFNLPPLPPNGQPNPVDEVAIFRYVVRRAGFSPVTLVEFKITREPTFSAPTIHNGYTSYVSGDIATIDTEFLKTTYSLGFTGTAEVKPKISGVKSLNTYQTIGGVQVAEGDRVLIQAPASIGGIYVVSPGTWERAEDFAVGTWAVGAEVFVTDGLNGGKLWRAKNGPGLWEWDQVGTQSNTNDWQEGNFWVSTQELERLGLDRSEVIQATRPIIEYWPTLQLNTRVQSGSPADGQLLGSNYRQEKTEFNQLPLFDLFRYDGTHSGLVSSIFYYVEDLTAEMDIALQRRVKRSSNDSADFLFNHGCVDNNGNLLFFRSNSELKTVWHAGYFEPTVVDISQFSTLVEEPGSRTFTGTGNGSLTDVVGGAGSTVPQTITITFTSPISPGGPMGFNVVGSVSGTVGSGIVGTNFVSDVVSFKITTGLTSFTGGSAYIFDLVYPGSISSVAAGESASQQIWTITAKSSTTFEVVGTKLKDIPSPYDVAVVGTPYDNGEISFVINSGVAPFTIGDSFVVRVANLDRPRYLTRNVETDSISDLFGGPANDFEKKGAWSVPLQMIYNPYNDSRSEIVEGSVYSHMRGIVASQVEGQPTDLAFGGNIKLWSEQHSLLSSLLMQKDMTPISMINMALRQYETGLNAIRDIYVQKVVEYFSSNMVVASDGTAAETAKVNELLEYILEIRKIDQDTRTVLFDTTASVVGFPATLPQLGISPLVEPHYEFDPVLGRTVFVHHDGHFSVPFTDSAEFRQELFGNLVGKTITRSDGAETPAIGSFTVAPPVPYKGELWIEPDGTLWSYDVDFDNVQTPDIQPAGVTWFNRQAGILYESDGLTWNPQPDHTVRWKQIDLAATLNELIFIVENRLHAGINSERRVYDFSSIETNPFYVQQLKRELFTFAAANGYDPLATNYNAQDPFTWNYSDATAFAPVSTPTVPARWYNALMAHQQTVAGVIPTERPNLEPWKLFGFSTFNAWWSSLSGATQAAYTPFATQIDGTFSNGGSVRVVKTTSGVTPLTGLQTIDGVVLQNGDKVLLVSELSPINNGVWTVGPGSWTRTAVTVAEKTYYTVSEGSSRAGTIWAVTTTAVVGSNPIIVKQVRQWTDALWAAVASARPTLKTSVNPFNDDLLPPYVVGSSASAAYALTNIIPSGIALPYEFGEGSPVEEVWTRSIEYGYAQAKALFRFDPLAFLGFCWGFNWVEVDGILYDGFDMQMPGHKRFMLHGENIQSIGTRAFNLASISATAPIDITVTYDAYDAMRRQNFSVRDAGGVIIQNTHSTVAAHQTQNLVEGVSTDFVGGGITMVAAGKFIEDAGRPFRIGDKWHITANADGSNLQVVFIPAAYHQILGFGQTFVNALREVSIDQTSSYAISAFREWDVNMGYRAGGLVATDDLIVLTEQDTLNDASYTLKLKKNEGSRSLWIQGLRISVLQYGERARINGIDTNIPADDAANWVFRVEGYNPRYLDISYYTYDASTSRQTFYALDRSATNLLWTHPLEPNAIQTTQLPLTITGLQNVIDFLFGYSHYLFDQGWQFESDDTRAIDSTTGRRRNWQLEIEKFVDGVYRGLELSQGLIVNPFIDFIQVRQETGLMGQFSDAALFDVYSHAAVYDVEGSKIKTSDILVERGNLISQFSAKIPMFSAHVLIDEYEHLFIFNNFINGSDASGLLYDPFSGSRVVSYKFNGRRSNTSTLRPELGGYYMANDQVRLNLQASVDGINLYYDANSVFENSLTSKHALALLGFNKKEYFTNLDITNKSQFNFWRGLVQSKGTNMSIDAYLNNERFKDAKVDEFWAYKVAEYGDARQKTFPELRLQVDDCLQQFTSLQFDADETITGAQLPNFTQITRFDEDRWFSIDDLDQDTYFKADVIGSYSKTVTAGEVVYLPFIADELDGIAGTAEKLNANTLIATADGPLVVTGYGPASPRFSPVKLFNYESNELIEEIPLWNPAAGKHTPVALESINIISDINPARYNYSTLVVNNNSYDPLRPWGDKEVGRVWFDTRNLAYIPYYDSIIFPNRAERLSRWGALADYATVDVYEWVKSSVPPTEYDALSATDAGNADIDSSVKASGQVALQETFARDRIWKIRPIAWSHNPVAVDVDWGDRPPMKYSGDISGGQLHINNQRLTLQSGTFSAFGIEAGDRIGTWRHGTAPSPLSEGVINDSFTQYAADINSTTNTQFGVQLSGNYNVELIPVEYTTERLIGQILVSHIPMTDVENIQIFDVDGNATDQWDVNYYITIADNLRSERVLAYSVRATGTTTTVPTVPMRTVAAGQRLIVEFPISGIQIAATAIMGGTFAAGEAAAAIATVLADNIDMRDSVTVEWITSAPDTATYSNDPEEAANIISGDEFIGWRVWTVPTQAQLDGDGRYPVSSWKPYAGDSFVFAPSYERLAEAIAYAENPLTLNNGTVVERYDIDWTEWSKLEDVRVTKIAETTGVMEFSATDFGITKFDANRTSVYVNGIAQLKAAYTIVGETLTVLSVQRGFIVTVIVRRYEPTDEELSFNPDVEEDLSFQRQYKKDYEYVSQVTRDSDGNFDTTYYYFWVKNKSTQAKGKKMSVQSITQNLVTGPANFLTFQNLLPPVVSPPESTKPWRYDAITISGLSYVVMKDDTFKLRFTRNFTLRDDPNELDLKNTHTEWSLMRPGQKTKIPERLWLKLVESTAGEDLAGNPVPSLRRVLYDERNGTQTQFGFGAEQTLAPAGLLRSSLADIIVNTRLEEENPDGTMPDYIEFIDEQIDLRSTDGYENPVEKQEAKSVMAKRIEETFFSTPELVRTTLTSIWTDATVAQINEMFFAALEDIIASNYELTDIFKTSRISLYSIQEKRAGAAQTIYE